MKLAVTVLYEDSQIGQTFPLHDLVVRMVEDDLRAETWKLRKLVDGKPRKGIDNVLRDVRAAQLLAGAGSLFVLADSDKLVNHVRKNARPGEAELPKSASPADAAAAIKATAGSAATRVEVFILDPNMEGLLQHIATCQPDGWGDDVSDALQKNRVARDLVLKEASKAKNRSLRDCIRNHQTSLDTLVKTISVTLNGHPLLA